MSEFDLDALKVMVIDDHKSMRSILRQMLGAIGVHDVIEAEDGGQALQTLRGERLALPDLIICDLYMNGMGGSEFCNTLRRDKEMPGHGIPVLVLTGEQDDFVHDVVRQIGAVEVVVKPISPEELLDQLRKAVGFEL